MNSNDPSDHDLLLAYSRDGQEAAFEALARRHVDMIFAVSLRRSNHRQLAEEATQNVLLGLSRKARMLSAQERNLTAWLHSSTKFEVAKLQRREARLKTREQAYADQDMKNSTRGEDEAFQRLYPILDQAIDSLPASDREVIVRRYLEGHTFRRIALALGISEDAAQKRASRAFERLNVFFRRRAGITISTVALAAGISQHCAEAAPASCLGILGQAAAPGASSGLISTIITSMSTKKIAAAAAAVAILGGTVTFIATRSGSPADAASLPPALNAPPRPSSPEEPGSALAEVAENMLVAEDRSSEEDTGDYPEDYSPNRELARLEAMSPNPGKDEFARRLSVKHDQLLKDLTVELELEATQVMAVKAVLDARLKIFRAALETGPGPADTDAEAVRKEKEMLANAGGIVQGEGLREELMEILSETQLAAFDEREAEDWRTQVESHAYAEFSRIAPALDLTEEQKDRVFELLQASSEHVLRSDGAARAFVAMQRGQAASHVDLPDSRELDLLDEALDSLSSLTPESPEFRQRIIEVVGGRIEERVALLAPVLDEGQTRRYREYLAQQSLLGELEIPFPAND